MVDLDALLPPSRTPRDYLNAVTDPRLDAAGLRQLARSPYGFVRLAVAQQPRADASVLAELLTEPLAPWDANRLYRLVAEHPNADRAVLLRVLDRTEELLRAGSRPYGAAIALAVRTELTPAEIDRLRHLPGASRRLRRGLTRALTHARTPRGHRERIEW
ncbi:hypothetical protein [Actinocatenispora sera]|uniref:Uncharacterized protein n=1 Tax=Actinocatenispora sera TaxID=390989 RepID=A0A810LE08_9ACTN|nr:hypothetical protein [Actinocatenispora sera]BCJ32441.1 hypothetical protein Asera_65490 [Actinocatenispora sera]